MFPLRIPIRGRRHKATRDRFWKDTRTEPFLTRCNGLPELLSYLQQIVDEGPKSCRFVLTGSQQFGLKSKITQSLAGRSALIHLLPFSYDELYSFRNENPALESALFAGLYPPIHDRGLDPQKWYADYVETYIERDVRSLLNIQDLSVFQLFLKMCASAVRPADQSFGIGIRLRHHPQHGERVDFHSGSQLHPVQSSAVFQQSWKAPGKNAEALFL